MHVYMDGWIFAICTYFYSQRLKSHIYPEAAHFILLGMTYSALRLPAIVPLDIVTGHCIYSTIPLSRMLIYVVILLLNL